ncbi:MAG: helix-turn-helix domain-containing protein [Prevotellaceae bacterium]|nr:helix-turn-helix domain-containing protein [Prevotellaceae bacterium]
MRHSDQLTSYDGLGHETVFKIYKDKEGLLWLGTNRGVRSYNGHAVTKIEEAEEMGMVHDITENAEGRLFAGGATGLYEIDREKGRAKRIATEITDVNALCGRWIGGNCGLWMNVGDDYKAVPIESSVISKGNAVTDIVDDGKGGVWVSTNKRIVHLSETGNEIKKYNIPDTLLTHNISCICLIGKMLYIGTRNDGLLAFDVQSGKTERVHGIPSDVIADLNSDDKRMLYIATDGNGAYSLDTTTGQTFPEPHGKSDAVYTFWKDKDLGITLLGYYLDGFSHTLYSRNLVSTFCFGELDTRLLPIRSFCRNGKQIAIGTRKGLYLIDEGSGVIKHCTPEELGASIVTNISYFGERFVVATYESGLRTMNKDGQLHTIVTKGSFSHLCIAPDGKRLFAISNMGVTVINEDLQVIKQFTSKNSELPDEYLTDIIFDSTGKAWISSLSRLCVYDPLLQTIQSTGFPKGFFNNAPSLHFALAKDGDMLAWSGRKLYKSRLDFSSFEELPLCQEMHIDEISFIRHKDNHYWIGTTQGLLIVDEDLKTAFQHISEADGLPSPRLQEQQWQVASDGTLWIATSGGIAMMSAEQQKHLNDRVHGQVVLNSTVWEGSQLTSFQPLLMNYSTDLGKMYEWQIDDGNTEVCMDGETVELNPLSWGRHTLSVWLLGHPETRMDMHFTCYPSLMFWACLAIVTLIGLGIYLARREAVDTYKATEDERKRQEEERRMAKLYERQRLSKEECETIYNNVQSHVETTKCYTNPSLRLSDVAEAVGSTPAKLSQMFSMYAGKSFPEYLNVLRVEEFKRRAADPQYNQFTTIALAEMCGMKKSAFFAAFKKIEGCTPNEWMEQKGITRR